MMVGDPFSGKTKVLEVLAETLNVLTDRGYDDENVNKVTDQAFSYLKNQKAIIRDRYHCKTDLSHKTSLISHTR